MGSLATSRNAGLREAMGYKRLAAHASSVRSWKGEMFSISLDEDEMNTHPLISTSTAVIFFPDRDVHVSCFMSKQRKQ